MKFLVLLLLAGGSVALGWFVQPSFQRSMEDRRAAAPDETAEPSRSPAVRENDAAAASAGSGNKASQAFDTMKPADGTPAPVVASADPATPAAAMPADAPAAPVDEIDARYPLPVFRNIEEITREWSFIPARAFPRTVKLKTPVTFEGASGKSVLQAGADALAIGMTRGFLVLMKSRNDSARAMAPLANTDLKETLITLYDRYREAKTKQVMNQRDRARRLLNQPVADNATSSAGTRPEQLPDGVIPLMLESLKRGDIKEVTPDTVTRWGTIQLETIDGVTCWTGTLECTVDNALFGPTPTEVLAVIRNGRVLKWLYTGSREPVQ